LDIFANWIMGLSVAIQPYNIMIAAVGIVLGIIVVSSPAGRCQWMCHPYSNYFYHEPHVGHYFIGLYLLGSALRWRNLLHPI